jgi:hypothetical protein
MGGISYADLRESLSNSFFWGKPTIADAPHVCVLRLLDISLSRWVHHIGQLGSLSFSMGGISYADLRESLSNSFFWGKPTNRTIAMDQDYDSVSST